VALKGVYDPSYPGLVSVVIVNHVLSCGVAAGPFGSGDIFQNMVVVAFTLGATDGATVVTPGTYTAGSLTGGCEAHDAQCKELPGGSENTGGTVTLTSAGPTVYAGTFTFECTCGTYTGSFEAPLCATPDAGSAGDAGMACLP
jgi:hypothetical protein